MFDAIRGDRPRSYDEAIFLWVTNRGAAEITANSVVSLVRTGAAARHRLVVVATDRDAQQVINGHAPKAEILGLEAVAGALKHALPEDYQAFASPTFNAFCILRYVAIRRLLATTGRPVIYSDGDVVFLRNPAVHFESEAALRPGMLLAQNDRPGCPQLRDRQYGPGEFSDGSNVCSGFTAWQPLRAHLRLAAAIERRMARRNPAPEDQCVFNALPFRHLRHVQLLRQDLYPNGAQGIPLGLDGNEILFHANWIQGMKNKIALLKVCGLWFL